MGLEDLGVVRWHFGNSLPAGVVVSRMPAGRAWRGSPPRNTAAPPSVSLAEQSPLQ